MPRQQTPFSQRFPRFVSSTFVLWYFALCASTAVAATSLSGSLTDPQGSVVGGATVRLLRRADSSRREAQTDTQGQFSFAELDSGEYRVTAEYPGFAPTSRTIMLSDGNQIENIKFSDIASQSESVTVSADVSDAGLFAPDPAQRILVRDETLDANPGRPGMPISFVPGVAGDHGEPIAMFFQVGG